MRIVWNENEAGNPTEQGLDEGSQQAEAVIETAQPVERFPVKDLTVSIHRHLDGKLLHVMKTIANAGRVEIHVDVPITE